MYISFKQHCQLSELTSMTKELRESYVIKTIRALDVNKTHSRDNISVRMIKLCTISVTHPLTLITVIRNGKTVWKHGPYLAEFQC